MAGEEKQVTVHVSAALDAELRSSSGAASHEFRKVLAKYRSHPKPLFPDRQAPGAQPIWHLSSAAADAPALVAELSRTPGVEGAYLNPEEGMPGPK